MRSPGAILKDLYNVQTGPQASGDASTLV